MIMRGRREQRRAERSMFGPRGSAQRYQLQERLVSIGDDFWIENDSGERVFKVNGKAFRVRRTLDIEDRSGRRLCRIQKRVMRLKDTMEIEGPDGKRMAVVRQALITPLRERWRVDVEEGPGLEVHGNLVDHEYRVEADGRQVAEVSRRWFRARDTYGIEVDPSWNTVLLLAVAVAIDAMTRS